MKEGVIFSAVLAFVISAMLFAFIYLVFLKYRRTRTPGGAMAGT